MKKPLGVIFLENIRYLYKKTGANQTTIARRGGFSQGGFSDLLSNPDLYPNPSLDLVERIAKGFGVPAIWLLTDHKRPSQRVECFPGYEVVCGMLPEIEALQVRMMLDRRKRDWEEKLLQLLLESDKEKSS